MPRAIAVTAYATSQQVCTQGTYVRTGSEATGRVATTYRNAPQPRVLVDEDKCAQRLSDF